MKITKQELIEIIKEEVERSLDIEEQEEIPGVTTLQDEDPPEESEIFNQSLPANGVEHPKFGKIPYTDEEMTAFFDPMGAVFGDGGGVDALAKDDKFQSASKKGRLLILKVATKYIRGGNLKDMSVEGLPDEDLKKSEYRKLKRLYKKNHPNLKGMMRKRAAQKNKKDFEAAHGSMSPEEYAATVSGEDFEAPINTTAPSKDTMMTGIPRDDNDIPMINPGLPKNWRELPRDSKERVDYRNWKKTYGGGSKRSKMKDTGTGPFGQANDPEVRKTLERADARIAKIYDFHKNRSPELTAKRLTSKTTWERRSLQSALKLYGKAAKAGNKRAAKEIAMVKQLMRGELRAFGKGPRAEPMIGDAPSPKKANPSNFRDRSKPFTAKKEPRGAQKKPPFPSKGEWMKKNRKKYATQSIADRNYELKKTAYDNQPADYGKPGGPKAFKKTIGKK